MASGNATPRWASPSCQGGSRKPRRRSEGSSPHSSLESQRRSSGGTTPTSSRRRQFLAPRRSTESLPGSVRSRSPRPRSESDALEAPGLQQEALTRALIYPSSLHSNLRLAGLVLVMLHVSYKRLVPWLVTPFLDRLSLDWTPRSLIIGLPH